MARKKRKFLTPNQKCWPGLIFRSGSINNWPPMPRPILHILAQTQKWPQNPTVLGVPNVGRKQCFFIFPYFSRKKIYQVF